MTTPDGWVGGCLTGAPGAALPADLARCRHWWVAALEAPLAITPGRLVVQPAAVGRRHYAVVGGPPSTRTEHVRALLGGNRAGLSRRSDTPDLAAARREADLALEIARPSEVVTVDDRRSAIVVHHVVKALATLPDLGDDPLARLADHDRRRDGRLVDTLRCWLTSTTDELAIHSNTLRYRLRRIEEITGVDLRRDTMGRLELQLLLAAQPQLSRSTSSTAS